MWLAYFAPQCLQCQKTMLLTTAKFPAGEFVMQFANETMVSGNTVYAMNYALACHHSWLTKLSGDAPLDIYEIHQKQKV